MMRVSLSKDEATWFSRNVIKTKTLLEANAKKDAKILERKTYLTLAKLAPQAEEMSIILEQLGAEPFEIDLLLEEKQKRILRDMIDLTVVSLETRILPEYERRGDSMKDYTQDVRDKLVTLKAMHRKFK